MRKLRNSELGRPTVEQYKGAKKLPVVLLLDNVRSLNNVGSAFRTGDAFLVEKIFLCGITGTPPHRDIQKTALGATDSVNWEYQEDPKAALENLKVAGFKIALIEQTDQSVSLADFNPGKDTQWCFVFGNEVKGISESILPLADQCLEIPQFGTKHSLNISVSVGVVLWDYLSKTRLGRSARR